MGKGANKLEWQKHLEDIAVEFKNLKDAPDTWTMPFVPWCGERYWDAEARILFVGKSVGAFNDEDAEPMIWRTGIRDWQKSEDINLPEKLTNDYMTGRLAKAELENPAFFVFPLLVASALNPACGSLQDLVHSFAWSNLYKVNDQVRMNFPSREGITTRCSGNFCLLEKSVEWLRREIEILEPDFVLLGLGREEWKNIQGEMTSPEDDHRGFPMKLGESWMGKIGLKHRPIGIWVTYHFSSWTARHKQNGHATLLLEMRNAGRKSREPVERLS